ncbi:MAG: hypothetical protein ABR569_11690, partial [Gaiellaceae bacterium]
SHISGHWHLLADPAARYHDFGADFYTRRIDNDRKTRQLVHQLRALGQGPDSFAAPRLFGQRRSMSY